MGFSLRRPRRFSAPPPTASKAGNFYSDGHGDSARLHRGQQQQGLFTQTATATARASTGGNKSRDFHSDGRDDGARLHRGQHKQRFFTPTATASSRASTGGNKIRDFSLKRPRRQSAPPPGAAKTGISHSDGHGFCARLHRGQQNQAFFTQTATAIARASTRGNNNKDFHSDGHGDGARLHRRTTWGALGSSGITFDHPGSLGITARDR